MTAHAELERVAKEAATRRLTNEGFQVIVEPSRETIPSFLGQYVPDLIAFAPSGPNKVVEIRTKSVNHQRRLREIRQLFEGVDDWELMVVLLDPAELPSLPQTDVDGLKERGLEFAKLMKQQLYVPALFVAWSILEGLVRLQFYDQAQRALKPATAVQILETEGFISSGHANKLRELATKRNDLIHGVYRSDVSFADMLPFKDVLFNLIDSINLASEVSLTMRDQQN
jgi:hypothetical protein